MAAGLLPESRLEVPVVAQQHQWDKPAGVWQCSWTQLGLPAR